MSDVSSSNNSSPRFTRRSALKWGVGTTAGLVGVGALGSSLGLSPVQEDDSQIVAFDGRHQAGVITPMQNHLFFASFDITAKTRNDVIALLRDWTTASRQMTIGKEVGTGAVGGAYIAPPDDTGEALQLSPSHLTITFGFGASFFHHPNGQSRFGVGDLKPKELRDLPKFRGDDLDEWRTGGDICIQACANDPQVALHAVRNLARLAFGRASLKWSQLGYGPSAAVGTHNTTPRNLFGFKDGTSNLNVDDSGLTTRHLWLTPADNEDAWTVDGTYMIVRRIRMTIETWDRSSLEEQEKVIGRDKLNGAPLSGGSEFTAPDFALLGSNRSPIIPTDSHIALAHPDNNGGVRMLRRGFNYVDGNDSLGRLDAGLFFVAFVKSPEKQFIPIQSRMASHDALSEYIKHTGSGVFFVPAGCSPESYIGESLFA